MAGKTCTLDTWEAEAGGWLQMRGQAEPHIVFQARKGLKTKTKTAVVPTVTLCVSRSWVSWTHSQFSQQSLSSPEPLIFPNSSSAPISHRVPTLPSFQHLNVLLHWFSLLYRLCVCVYSVYVYVSVRMCLCVWVCMCVCNRIREEEKDP